MKSFFFRIGRRVSDILNLDAVGKKYKVLAVNYVFFMIYATIEGTFVNTLLYRVNPSMSIVITYRAIIFITAAIAMQLAAYLSQKKTPLVVIRLGPMFYLLMYLTLFFGMDYMSRIYYFTAILAGLGAAFYWSAHSILVGHYTTKQNRDIGISVLGIIQGLIALACPVISGFVIKLMPGNTGYRIMFGFGMLAVIGQVIIQTKFYPIEQRRHVSYFGLAFKLVRAKLSYQLMLSYEFVRGLRDGTFAFIVNMLLFEIVTDESLIGINTFLTGLMAITGSWAYGKLVKSDKRVKYSILATTVLLTAGASLMLKTSAITMMIFTVLNSFTQLFLAYSVSNTTFDVVSQSGAARRCMGELLSFREITLDAGRLTGLLFISVFSAGQQGYLTAMLILTATQYVACFLMRLTTNTMQKHEKKPVLASTSDV